MTRIVLLTGNALCNNPRAQKEAEALAEVGFDVTILGAWMSAEIKKRDREMLAGAPYAYEAVLDVADSSAGGRLEMLLARVKTGAGRKLYELLGAKSRSLLGYPVDQLLRRALLSSADLYIAHSEVGLYAARALHRRGRRIGVDMEDWFSEDLPPESRCGRPVDLLKELEQYVLRHAVHATCTSAAMSSALAIRYRCPPPRVIYNAFPWKSRKSMDGQTKDRASDSPPSIHWYSQTLGPDRGLETLMAALPQMKADAQVHLRGRGSSAYRDVLYRLLPAAYRSRVHFHEPVAGPELLSRIAEHDIGFSGERSSIPSRDLTVTNKILHYLLAGLPVVASDTSGNREIAARAPEAVFLWPEEKSDELASRIDSLLLDPDRLNSAKSTALRVAEKTFCWEQQMRSLTSSIGSAVARGSKREMPTKT